MPRPSLIVNKILESLITSNVIDIMLNVVRYDIMIYSVFAFAMKFYHTGCENLCFNYEIHDEKIKRNGVMDPYILNLGTILK
jgi:hypothetical protein